MLPGRKPALTKIPRSNFSVANKSHVLVRLIAERGEVLHGDSGRLVLDENFDLPEPPDIIEWRGR